MMIVLSRHGKVKSCALTHYPLCPNASIVSANDALYNCQTYTGAFKFAFAVQSLEDTEQFVRVFHVETCPGITHKINDLFLAGFASYFDGGSFLLGGKL